MIIQNQVCVMCNENVYSCNVKCGQVSHHFMHKQVSKYL